MPYKRPSNKNSRDDDRRSSGRQQSSRSSSSRGGGRQQQQQASEYFPILAIFSNEQRGRRSLQIKRLETSKTSIEDVLTLDQFLFIMERVYYGEVTLYGSLWESDSKFADMTGNIRFSDEQLETALEGFEEETKAKKTPTKKSKPASKPKYNVPEPAEDEEEDEYEEEDSEQEDEIPPY